MWKSHSAILALLAVLASVGCLRQAAVETGATSDGAGPPMNTQNLSGWDVAIATSGGITGRGLGEIAVDSSGAGHVSDMARGCDVKIDAQDVGAIARRVVSSDAARWKDSYASPANPHGYADQIRYELTFSRVSNGTAEKRTTFWFDENIETLPDDLVALRETVWDLREKLLAQCGK